MTKIINQMTDEQQQIINQIWEEIQLIPQEQQKNLLQIVQTFRRATSQSNNLTNTIQFETEKQQQIQKNQVIIDLLHKWEVEGNEQEQTETLNYLREISS